MKTTGYFDFRRTFPDRIMITDSWISRVLQDPADRLVQSDGRIRVWGWIKERNRYLRVVLLEDGETVHNAFFDRSFQKGNDR